MVTEDRDVEKHGEVKHPFSLIGTEDLEHCHFWERSMGRPNGLIVMVAAGALIACLGGQAQAGTVLLPGDLGVAVNESAPWLFIGTGPENDSVTLEGLFNGGVGDAVDHSNYEIGAIKAPVPANNGPPFGTGEDWSPDMVFESSVLNVPGVTIDAGPSGIVGILPQGQNIDYSGNVAITSPDGGFGVSNMGIFALNQSSGGPTPNGMPAGIVTAGPAATAIQNNSNSFFNDVNYPNSVNDPTPQTGDPAMQLALGNGVTENHDFSNLRSVLDAAHLEIPGLPGAGPEFVKLEINNNGAYIDLLAGGNGHTIRLLDSITGLSDGEIKGDDLIDPTNMYVQLNPGLNIIDFDTGGTDLLLNNGNIIVDEPADSFAVFRVPTDSQFNINQGNILTGNMGIGPWNVMFYSDTMGDTSVFEFNDTILNLIAFWTLGDGAGSNVNNSQGCVQYVGDKLNMQNIRYVKCHFSTAIPLPAAVWMGFALLGDQEYFLSLEDGCAPPPRRDIHRNQLLQPMV